MHQIRQKKPKPSKRNATGSSIASSIDDRADERARPTSADERCASDERARRSRRVIDDRAGRSTIALRDLVDRRSSIAPARSSLSLLSLSL